MCLCVCAQQGQHGQQGQQATRRAHTTRSTRNLFQFKNIRHAQHKKRVNSSPKHPFSTLAGGVAICIIAELKSRRVERDNNWLDQTSKEPKFGPFSLVYAMTRSKDATLKEMDIIVTGIGLKSLWRWLRSCRNWKNTHDLWLDINDMPGRATHSNSCNRILDHGTVSACWHRLTWRRTMANRAAHNNEESSPTSENFE